MSLCYCAGIYGAHFGGRHSPELSLNYTNCEIVLVRTLEWFGQIDNGQAHPLT